ncbi:MULTISPECIES: EutN/CcmL family microcompartment protein [Atlantibacter]|uniref:Ethanolamine utilization protein EutN n=2 Tax=Atlantibacter hermannii TaxID=565 RepID=H5V720_ATLHE|nr:MULTISPECIES: EutN/CcmL family microcompartment protein [Atlantibacter]MCQ4967184.1 EutN/CcmL family microcompartment protein [Enterobacteriaceae bacterium DFI.7.85]HAI48831.1 ethanolamine utilization protein EutN [Enterobacteriaceae bacterium]KIU31407.1 ethanolamine utilization protein EutN [Atlantibacter hermannii]MBW9430179.1 EutN/CcmL family microcompartment protein [Atlantibacter hermannii]MDQ7881924.1 EutN/CcmL family microcompartment protein [Atlantibacter hermannii]
MYLAKVTGALVSTTKHVSLNGSKLLMVARLDENYQPTGHAQVAVDTVGAGNGEIVIVTTGSSARMSNSKEHSVIDAAVVGIVDSLELNGK